LLRRPSRAADVVESVSTSSSDTDVIIGLATPAIAGDGRR
jgi:hypothetical protein